MKNARWKMRNQFAVDTWQELLQMLKTSDKCRATMLKSKNNL